MPDDADVRHDPSIAQRILAEANRRHGHRFQLIRPLKSGLQSGMWLLTDDRGGRAVMKWSPDRTWAPQINRAAKAVARIRAQGYPTPAWLAVGTNEDGFAYQIQDFAAGASSDRVALAEADALIEVLELQNGLDPDPERCWSRHTTTQLTEGWADLHRAASAIGPAVQPLLDDCERLLTATKYAVLPTGDLVHGDFRPGNVLFDRHLAATVIDIEALGSGTRAFDYATLLTAENVDPPAQRAVVDAGLRVAGAPALTRCFVAAALDLVVFMRRRRLPQLWSSIDRLHGTLRDIDT